MKFELVPSQFMRNFYNEIGFQFTDFQKATLIWNTHGKTRCEILDALKELSEITKEENIRKQILERVDFEERAFTAFVNNQATKYVYVIEDEENYSCGFFADYDKAVEYAVKYIKKYETHCSIKKQLIITKQEEQIVRNPWKVNPNMGIETDEYSDYNGDAVASVSLNANGEIQSFWSCELTKSEESVVDEYRRDRFEYSFIKVPFDLQVGMSVKDVVSGTYGVLAQGKEEWNKYLQDIENRKLYVDFSDIQVIVYKITETGYWSHEHINPMYLEIEFPPYIQNDEKRTALRHATEAFGDYLSHKSKGELFCPDLVLKYAKEYASICHEKSYWENIVENAKEPEELMW